MKQYCLSKKKSCVIFERNFKSQHLQLQVKYTPLFPTFAVPLYIVLFYVQVVPVPETPPGALRQAFIDHGKALGIQLNEMPPDVPVSKVRLDLDLIVQILSHRM